MRLTYTFLVFALALGNATSAEPESVIYTKTLGGGIGVEVVRAEEQITSYDDPIAEVIDSDFWVYDEKKGGYRREGSPGPITGQATTYTVFIIDKAGFQGRVPGVPGGSRDGVPGTVTHLFTV